MRSNKELGREKTSRIPIKIVPIESLKKPAWIKMQLPKTIKRNVWHVSCNLGR